MLALREHDEETAGIVHWDFNDERGASRGAMTCPHTLFFDVSADCLPHRLCRVRGHGAFRARPDLQAHRVVLPADELVPCCIHWETEGDGLH